jgi:hypothetical protein
VVQKKTRYQHGIKSCDNGLELEDLIGQLGDSIDLVVAEILGDLGHGRDHRRGSAKEDLDVGSGLGHVLLDHVGGDETNTAGPALGRGVEDVVDLELGVLLGEKVELGLQNDILLGNVGKDEVDDGLVCGVLDNGADDLF